MIIHLRSITRKFAIAAVLAGLLTTAATPSFAFAQCAATTKKGVQCKRQAKAGSKYCWQHDPAAKKK